MCEGYSATALYVSGSLVHTTTLRLAHMLLHAMTRSVQCAVLSSADDSLAMCMTALAHQLWPLLDVACCSLLMTCILWHGAYAGALTLV